MARGARLYDKYWGENKTAKPTSDAEIVSAVTGSMTKVAAYFDTATQSQIRFTTDRVFGWNKISLTAAEIESCDYEAMERLAHEHRAVGDAVVVPRGRRHHGIPVVDAREPRCAPGPRHVAALQLVVHLAAAPKSNAVYVAYKAETNFVDVVPQMGRLLLSLNMQFHELVDPRGLARDVTGMGRWGNGDVEIGLSSPDDLSYVMGLVRQSFEKQMSSDDGELSPSY